jgi:hypothetical protein
MKDQQLTTLLRETANIALPTNLTQPVMAAIKRQQQQHLRLLVSCGLGALVLTFALLLNLYWHAQKTSLGYLIKYWWENSEWDWAGLPDSLELFAEILPFGALTIFMASAIILIWLTKSALSLRQAFTQLINNQH